MEDSPDLLSRIDSSGLLTRRSKLQAQVGNVWAGISSLAWLFDFHSFPSSNDKKVVLTLSLCLGRISEDLRLRCLVLSRPWTDCGWLETEIFDFSFGLGRNPGGLKLKSLILCWFWKDFGRG